MKRFASALSTRVLFCAWVLLAWLPARIYSQEAPTPWKTQHFTLAAKELHAQASKANPTDGADASVLTDDESYVFDAQGRSTYTEYLVYKVLTQKGADGWDSISVSWEPWHQERPIVRARVITPDYVVHELDTKTITDAPARDDDNKIYSDGRVLRAPLPAIAPGSVVEQEILIKENVALFPSGMVGRSFFGRVSIPVEHNSLSLQAPTAVTLRYEPQLLGDVHFDRTEKGGLTRLFVEHGPFAPLEEVDPYLPADAPGYPEISFSTGTSWQQVASEYSKIVYERLNASEVKAQVEKLTAAKTARNEKIQALMDYLDMSIRYTGIEFGEASIVPHSPIETLSHRYGDCKDKSTLLVAMLRAADIPAYLALLNVGSRQDIPSDLPGMGLFDHAIVFVPGSPDLWIDATDEYARLGELPADDQGRRALIIKPESTGLVRTFQSSSQDNVLYEDREIRLAENGPARVIETSKPRGVFESEFRDTYADKQNKKNKDNLTEYVKSQYLAEKLDRMDRSEPNDLAHPFELTLEAEKAKRAFTDIDSATAAIRTEGLFYRLPGELRNREDDDNKQDEGKPKKTRTADYLLRQPFVAEWHYKIVPPLGFQAKALPKNSSLSLGPAVLTETFETLTDGSISAVFRFDTLKRLFTVAEAREMRNRIADLNEGEAIVVGFEPKARALRDQGKLRESFQAYRSLISQHPTEALHHLQIAKALLDTGFGEAARQEANTAVKLEPKSALAHRTLAEILEYDLVGRKFRPGSDYSGALAAYREAAKLEPDAKEVLGDLAILLEYNQDGVRYGSGSNLKEAIAIYQKLGQEKLTSVGLYNNLAFAQYYAGDFQDARKNAETLNPQPKSLLIACEAALSGSAPALALGKKISKDDSSLKENLKTAGNMLLFMRKYPEAADLLEAGANGSNAAATAALAARLRQTQPREKIQPGNSPEDILKQSLLILLKPGLTIHDIESIRSKNAIKVLAETEAEELETTLKAGKELRHALTRTGTSLDAMIDVMLGLIDSKAEGDDSSGYREKLQVAGTSQMTLYIVKEEGKYKILDSSQRPSAIALEALDRIATNNLSGAAVLLNWIRDEQHIGGGDDPLAGAAFPRLWSKNKAADAQQMTIAAASILVHTQPTAKQGASLLEQAKASSPAGADITNIDLALLTGYEVLRAYDKQLALANALAKRYPDSRNLFLTQLRALQNLGRTAEADKLAEDRLKTAPDDLDAMRALVFNAVARRDYRTAYEHAKAIRDAGKADASDLNSLAWVSLYFDRSGGPDLESALKASQAAPNNWGILHTLGYIYAEQGQTKQAREVLVQAMDIKGADELEDAFWLAFGRIAEQYGEDELAKSYYSKVAKPKREVELPESNYELAQKRLKLLSNVATLSVAK